MRTSGSPTAKRTTVAKVEIIANGTVTHAPTRCETEGVSHGGLPFPQLAPQAELIHALRKSQIPTTVGGGAHLKATSRAITGECPGFLTRTSATTAT